ncbi:condensin complex subunit 3-like [Mantella aurantiaca]
MEAKQALEEAINTQDFGKASELKEKVSELESLKAQLIKEAEEPELKEIRVEKNDPETLLKCLVMCNELLKHISLSKGLGGTMNEIIQSLILPGITNVHPSVRNMAVLCIGCCALQSKEFAKQHLTLLLQWIYAGLSGASALNWGANRHLAPSWREQHTPQRICLMPGARSLRLRAEEQAPDCGYFYAEPKRR